MKTDLPAVASSHVEEVSSIACATVANNESATTFMVQLPANCSNKKQKRTLEVVALSLLATVAHAMELTSSTWDEATAGKSVFIKFQAPW
jgi:hypothetical protein